MPPRLALRQCLQSTSFDGSACLQRVLAFTTSRNASTSSQKRRRHDPYAIAQAKAKKAANKSRQSVLQQERKEILGDPVRGISTPFVQSFDTAVAPTESNAATKVASEKETSHVNFLLSERQLNSALERAKWLHNPLITTPFGQSSSHEQGSASSPISNETIQQNVRRAVNTPNQTKPDPETVSLQLNNAEEAVRRIAALNLGSGKDRQRANTQRVIEVFGRHNTDKVLQPFRLHAQSTVGESVSELGSVSADAEKPRAGPDTGSSEVQIAILTAKIRTLADFLESRGKKDKANKRNLRLLVHRRQRLLQYLRRKERGGPRWQHVISTLGLTEGTWKGEITL